MFRVARIAARSTRRAPCSRHMNSEAQKADSARSTRNYMIAGTLLAFTGGIYYTAISKMQQKDDLTELEQDAKA